eukprot:CAMPEP_0168627984 /NCGR_PEP_ID=MMETSP0449_2-20121227/11594_1 /TAXON_ID=1082188 /ORGANISM="Strombidium rassoulzadegani, Strain ras09" /LENGTH=95 /DNA_ID=CAMNT_0008670357 /DNA_START=199 /DNA_END=486 /DNA_ORIENTATION=+
MGEFLDFITKKGLEPLPEYYLGDNKIFMRYLQGCGWKNELAYEGIMQHHKWRQETFPMDGSKSLDFLQSGADYVTGRAKVGHQPIIIINVNKFIG